MEASLDDTEIADDRGPTSSVDVAEYRPNQIRATVDAPRPGILVVKDSYFPGWEATLDGVPTEVVRINGMVRGVVVPTAGPHEVTMRYRPASFVHGVMLASAVAVVLAALVGWGWSRHAHAGSRRRR